MMRKMLAIFSICDKNTYLLYHVEILTEIAFNKMLFNVMCLYIKIFKARIAQLKVFHLYHQHQLQSDSVKEIRIYIKKIAYFYLHLTTHVFFTWFDNFYDTLLYGTINI